MSDSAPFVVPGIEYGLLLAALTMTWAPTIRPIIAAYRVQCALVIVVIAFGLATGSAHTPYDWFFTFCLITLLAFLLWRVEWLMKAATLGRRPKSPPRQDDGHGPQRQSDDDEIRRLWELQAAVRTSEEQPGQGVISRRRAPRATRLRLWVLPLLVAATALVVSAEAGISDRQLPIALGLILLGAYNTATRREAISRVLGILTADQGLFLLAAARGAHFQLAIVGYTVFTVVVLVFLLPAVYWAQASSAPAPEPVRLGKLGWYVLAASSRLLMVLLILGAGVVSVSGLTPASKVVIVLSVALAIYAIQVGLRSASEDDRRNERLIQQAGAALVVIMLLIFVAAVVQVALLVNSGADKVETVAILLPDTSESFRLRIDALSVYFLLFTSAIGFAAALGTHYYAHAFVQANRKRLAQLQAIEHPLFLYAFTGLFLFTMLTAVLMDDLLTIWLWLVFTSVASTFLVGFIRNKENILASWTYAVFASISVGLAFVGIDLLQVATGTTDISAITAKLTAEISPARGPVTLSFLLIVVGYGVKAGLVPFHWWIPSAHSAAPSPVSAMLSGLLLKTSFYGIVRQMTITDILLPGDVGHFTSAVLLVVGVMTILLPVPFVLRPNQDFKRVLAYHGVVIMGMIALAFGVGTQLAIYGACLLLLTHAVTKALMFLAYEDIRLAWRRPYEGAIKQLASLPAGAGKARPLASGFLIVGGLALVATPLAGIFLSEAYTLESLLADAAGRWAGGVQTVLVAMSFVASSALVFPGLIRHLTHITLGEPNERPTSQLFDDREEAHLPWYTQKLLTGYTLLLITLFGLVVLFGFYVIPWVAHIANASVDIIRSGR